MSTFPVLRLELQGMRQALHFAFSEHQARVDDQVNAAIDAFCTPENLARVIDEEVNRVLKEAIQGAIKSFFTYGEGRDVIRAAVNERLREQGEMAAKWRDGVR